VIRRLLDRFRRPAHMGVFGDLADPFAACWAPSLSEIR
jgi:hypothetical protein